MSRLTKKQIEKRLFGLAPLQTFDTIWWQRIDDERIQIRIYTTTRGIVQLADGMKTTFCPNDSASLDAAIAMVLAPLEQLARALEGGE